MNLAYAAAMGDTETVTVALGDAEPEADRDYIVYARDDEILIRGIGEYTGSIVLDNAGLR